MPLSGDCQGTDPGLSVPPCPQPQFLDPPALLSPHNHAEHSASLGLGKAHALCRELRLQKRQSSAEQEGEGPGNSFPSGSLLSVPPALQQGACQ